MAEKKKSVKKAKKPGKKGITKDIGIRELVETYPESIPVLMEKGFHCLGCIAAQFETIGQGAQAHGIDPDELVKELNEAVKKKKKGEKKQKL
jgi:hybrid cluster-associated redox disulfide protein